MSELDRVQKLFLETFGSAPEAIYSAPGRVNLIGEHTDYNLGLSLPIAISQRTYLAISKTTTPDISLISEISDEVINFSIGEKPAGLSWALYPLGVSWALGNTQGFQMAFVSAVPVGSGLSSSAAIECATAVAINDMAGLNKTTTELALAAQKAENEVVGAPTGLMDQMASLMSKGGKANLIDFKTLELSHIDFDLDANNLKLLIIDSQVKHSHATGGYRERREQCESAAAKLGLEYLSEIDYQQLLNKKDLLTDIEFRRAKHIITDNHRVKETVLALAGNDFDALGEIFRASHDSLRDDFEVSCDELDLIVDTCYQHGAIAARMTGGGFGGAAIALIDAAVEQKLVQALEQAFEIAGFPHQKIIATTASAGAFKEA